MWSLLLLSSFLALVFSSCQAESTSTCDVGNNCGADATCVDLDSDPDHCGGCGNQCDEGEWCRWGTCCPEGEDCEPLITSGSCSGAVCEGECIEIWNEEHCGACDVACASGQACFAGECIDAGTSSDSGGDDASSSADGVTTTGGGSSTGGSGGSTS